MTDYSMLVALQIYHPEWTSQFCLSTMERARADGYALRTLNGVWEWDHTLSLWTARPVAHVHE